MPVDLPPPVVVTTVSEPAKEIVAQDVYGPKDLEEPEQRDEGPPEQLTSECPQTSENVITVCASVDPRQHRLGNLPPPTETAWNTLDKATTIKLGPAEIQPQVIDGETGSPIPQKGVGIGMRIRF
jgi:hypothetical protein